MLAQGGGEAEPARCTSRVVRGDSQCGDPFQIEEEGREIAGVRAQFKRLREVCAGFVPLPGTPERQTQRIGQLALERAMFEREGVSPTTIDRVLRPLLGSMLLDRTLEADAGYVRFLLAMIGRGPAILPVDGMGMGTPGGNGRARADFRGLLAQNSSS